MHYLLLFLEGIIAFISPCHLPLLPVYISFFAAGDTSRRKTFSNSIGFVLGFTLIFVILGAFAGTIGGLLHDYSVAVNIVAGLIVIVFGLHFLGVVRIAFFNRAVQKTAHKKELNFFSSVLFGIIFSVSWTPCVGAFLGSALMMASQSGGTMQGILMLLVFSLGMGVPFIASALLINRLKGAFDFIKRNYKVINIVSGLLLIVTGILIATGLMERYLHFLL